MFALLGGACGRAGFEPLDAGAGVSEECRSELLDLGPFQQVTRFDAGSSAANDDDPEPTADDLELVFSSDRTGTLGGADLWTVSRASREDAWGAPRHLSEASSSSVENTPALSVDGLTMIFVSNRPGSLNGSEDFWITNRPDRSSPWAAPVHVPELSSPQLDRGPSLFLDGLGIVFHSSRGGQDRLYVATRADSSAPWSVPALLGEPQGIRAWMSPCALELYFQRVGPGGTDLYAARREDPAERFGTGTRIDELSSTSFDQDLRLSADRRHAYFASDRAGESDLYEASR